jgi:hypothetical protein
MAETTYSWGTDHVVSAELAVSARTPRRIIPAASETEVELDTATPPNATAEATSAAAVIVAPDRHAVRALRDVTDN